MKTIRMNHPEFHRFCSGWFTLIQYQWMSPDYQRVNSVVRVSYKYLFPAEGGVNIPPRLVCTHFTQWN